MGRFLRRRLAELDEPVQRRIAIAARTVFAPQHVTAVFGAGQRDVGEAEVFHCRLIVFALVHRTCGVQFIDQMPVLVEIASRRTASGRKVEQRGQDHHRVLQPLAAVDGGDFHRVAVAFENLLDFVGTVVDPPFDRVGKEIQQCIDAQLAAAALLLEQVAELVEVGQLALAALLTREPGGNVEVFEKAGKHHDKGLRPPLPAQPGESGLMLRKLVAPLLRTEPQQFGKAAPSQTGRQRRQHFAAAFRRGNCRPARSGVRAPRRCGRRFRCWKRPTGSSAPPAAASGRRLRSTS